MKCTRGLKSQNHHTTRTIHVSHLVNLLEAVIWQCGGCGGRCCHGGSGLHGCGNCGGRSCHRRHGCGCRSRCSGLGDDGSSRCGGGCDRRGGLGCVSSSLSGTDRCVVVCGVCLVVVVVAAAVMVVVLLIVVVVIDICSRRAYRIELFGKSLTYS